MVSLKRKAVACPENKVRLRKKKKTGEKKSLYHVLLFII